MRSKKSASKMAVRLGRAKMQANDLQGRIAPVVDDARHRLTPVVVDTRDRLTPVVVDTRDRLTPVVDDARQRLTPVVDDARLRLAEVAGAVATRLDESLPDRATPPAVKKASGRRRGRSRRKITTVLLFAGLAAVAALVGKKLTESSQPKWQSTAPGRPMPPVPEDPHAPPHAEPAGAVGGLLAAEHTAPDPGANDAAGGGSPDEAAADAGGRPHIPTTPDHPAETIDLDTDQEDGR